MLGGVGYGGYHHWVQAPRERAALEQTLFEPYFQALGAGRVDEAWQRYTTPHYKQLFPLEPYRAHWQKAFAESGSLVKRNLATDNDAYQLTGGRNYTSVQYQLTFEHGYALAVYEVVPDASGKPLIDWAGQHSAGSAYTAPEAW